MEIYNNFDFDNNFLYACEYILERELNNIYIHNVIPYLNNQN